jgi:DNA-binding NarL/FixJ family response regulator
MFSQPSYAKKLFELGARGYLSKNSSKEEMLESTRENGTKISTIKKQTGVSPSAV